MIDPSHTSTKPHPVRQRSQAEQHRRTGKARRDICHHKPAKLLPTQLPPLLQCSTRVNTREFSDQETGERSVEYKTW